MTYASNCFVGGNGPAGRRHNMLMTHIEADYEKLLASFA